MPAHHRLSVHNVTFYGTPLAKPEGRLESAWCACDVVGTMLNRLGG
jgi:hypothetical protein